MKNCWIDEDIAVVGWDGCKFSVDLNIPVEKQSEWVAAFSKYIRENLPTIPDFSVKID